MKWLGFALVGLLTAAAGLRGGEGKTDLQLMEGTWETTIHEKDGVKTPEEVNKQLMLRLVVKGGKYTVYSGDKELSHGQIRLDPSKKPKEIDAVDEGAHKGSVMKGIYELKGDEMTVCFREPGGERPTEFKTKENSSTVLLGYRRVKK